jgi:prevent-host-death family protein
MSKHYNVADAKAQLSRLLDAALAGEDVVVSRAGTPLVRLVPVHPPRRREMGFLPMHIPDDAFDPLPSDELAGWS